MRSGMEKINFLGLYTLILREQKRFTAVWTQTILAPIVTSILFLTVFSFVLANRKIQIEEFDYTFFIAPGILTMSVMQNSFANTSSSLLISKVQGNIVDTLLAPLRPIEIVIGYMIGGILRGCIVSLAVILVIFPVIGLYPKYPFILLAFILVACAKLSLLGIVAGIFSQKFDHMQALVNFVVTPLSFLSGTFYSLSALPPILAQITSYNPIFFLIDGVRYGCLGYSESNPVNGFIWSVLICLTLIYLCTYWVSVGYKLKQ
jgi:ABC-2 type transport system permease protein